MTDLVEALTGLLRTIQPVTRPGKTDRQGRRSKIATCSVCRDGEWLAWPPDLAEPESHAPWCAIGRAREALERARDQSA